MLDSGGGEWDTHVPVQKCHQGLTLHCIFFRRSGGLKLACFSFRSSFLSLFWLLFFLICWKEELNRWKIMSLFPYFSMWLVTRHMPSLTGYIYIYIGINHIEYIYIFIGINHIEYYIYSMWLIPKNVYPNPFLLQPPSLFFFLPACLPSFL